MQKSIRSSHSKHAAEHLLQELGSLKVLVYPEGHFAKHYPLCKIKSSSQLVQLSIVLKHVLQLEKQSMQILPDVAVEV